MKQALRDMIKLIGLSPQDAYTLSSKPGPWPQHLLSGLTTSHPASAGGYLMRSWVLMKPRFTPAGAVS